MAAMLALLIMTYTIWGGSAAATKIALTATTPLLLAAFRNALTLMVLFVWNKTKGMSLKPKRDELAALFLTGLMSASAMGLLIEGLKLTTASRAVIFMHTSPFFVAGFAHFFLFNDRITVQKFLGLALAFSGIVILFAGKGGQASGSMVGDLLVISSAMILGGKLVWHKNLVMRINPAKLVFWASLISVILFSLSSFLFEENRLGALSAPPILTILYLGLVIGGYCFLCQATMLKYFSPNLVASFSFLVPLTGVTYGILLLREPLTQGLVMGAVLVTAGILVINYRSKAVLC
jgi:drug/metabolite transporter (DMT)-like permease